MSTYYRTLGRKLACSNSRFDVYFDVLELPNGVLLPDFLTVRPRVQDAQGICGVLVLPEVDGRVGLMRGYRHQFSGEIWQGPAGFIEPGESAQAAALRELAEETGLTCGPDEIVSLGTICPDAGLIEGRVALFFARCKGSPAELGKADEIGTGCLEYFSAAAFEELLSCAENIGGATLVAGYRYLGLRHHEVQP